MAISDCEPFGGDFEAYRWVAAQVLPAKEFAAARLLRMMGFAALVPKVTRQVRYSRHAKRTRPVDYPLIAGYVLAGVPSGHDWMEVGRAGLVRGIVGRMIGDTRVPLFLVTKELRRVVEEFGDGSNATIRAPATEPGEMFSVISVTSEHVGREVLVEKGPFAGRMVELSEIDGKTARVLLPLFGGVSTPIPLDFLRASAQS